MRHVAMNEDIYQDLKEIYEENKLHPNKIITYKGEKFVIKYLKFVLQHWESLTETDKKNMI